MAKKLPGIFSINEKFSSMEFIFCQENWDNKRECSTFGVVKNRFLSCEII